MAPQRARPGVVFDAETCSVLDLRKAGAQRYALDCIPLCLVYRMPGQAVQTWQIGEAPPAELVEWVKAGGIMYAWNIAFDFAVWNAQLVPLGFPPLVIEQCQCIMARALYWGLPASLDQAGKALGLAQQKDMQGHALMMRMARPRAEGPPPVWWHETDPGRLAQLVRYCAQDVATEAEAHDAIPDLPPAERRLWLLDQAINARGVRLDLDLVDKMHRATGAAARLMDQRVSALTGGAVTRLSQRAQLLAWLQAQGYVPDDLRRATVLAHLPQATGPEAEGLRLRLDSARTSTAKLASFQAVADPQDHRARGLIQYYGAGRTGRWAGRLCQPHNLPRPTIKRVDLAVDQLAAEVPAAGIELFHEDSALGIIASCLRGCFVPRPGHLFVVSDLAQIEARVIAWLAGQTDILRVFASGQDVYTYTANKVGSQSRQFGKVLTLACVAHDAPVLTDTGWKPIQNVLVTDLVWDGGEWVRHLGLVERGQRETLARYGLPLTPDHLVSCGTEWLPAQSVALDASTRCRALATASANLPLQASSPGHAAGWWPAPSNAIADSPNISSSSTVCGTGIVCGATPVPGGSSTPPVSCTGDMPALSPTTTTAAGCLTALLQSWAAVLIPKPRTTTTTAGEGSRFTRLGKRTGPRFFGILSRFRAGISRRWNWTGKTWTADTSRAICGSSPAAPTSRTSAASAPCKPGSTPWKPRSQTYDLAFAGPRSRFTIMTSHGPLIVHNCGFGMAGPKFRATAATYGLDMTEDAALGAVAAWREANPDIVRTWYAYGKAADLTVLGQGKFSRTSHRVHFEWWRGHMLITLPSGRQLVYRDVRMENDPGWQRDSVVYSGVDQRTRQWGPVRSYGGKWAENITQAVARDILADALLAVEAAGLSAPVLSVHDEIISEARADMAPAALAFQLRALRTAPSWAKGLPIGAEGSVMARYGK